MTDYSKYSELKVVYADVVVSATQDGWTLVEVVPSTKAEVVSTQKHDVTNPYQSFHDESVHVVECPLFLLGRVRDAVIDDLRQQVVGLNKSLSTALHEAAPLREQLDAAEKKIAKQARYIEVEAKKADDTHARWARALDTLTKLETDLAKIRAAIGTEKMKEILG